MLGAVARKLFGSSNDRRVRKYQPRADMQQRRRLGQMTLFGDSDEGAQ